MMRRGGPGDGTPSLESLRELRLGALLRDLVNDLGPGKAAEQFGVDRKTLWRWQKSAVLPPRLAETLERMLLERAVSAAGQDRERVRALEERVADLERQLAAALAAGDGGGNSGDVGSAVADALRQEFAQEIQRLERQLAAALAAGDGGGNSGDVGSAVADALRQEFAQEIQRLERRLDRPSVGRGATDAVTGGSRAGRTGAQRRYDELVTREPADDDEQVYGAAWPLVDEWRGLWAGHSPTGRGLAWVSARERILELEVAMLEEHGLTLPQETAPLRGLDRGEQLNWRVRELAGVRRKRARLELLRWARRVMTLGLWRQ